MSQGLCTFPLVACRREPNERAEMVSQLVYGEKYEVLDNNGEWLQIRNLRDDYESWIDAKLHFPFSTEIAKPIILEKPFNTYIDANSVSHILPAGAIVDGELHQLDSLCSLTETAQKFIDAPYLWGGKSKWGIDCSGFVQTVFQIHGIDISRDAYQQAEWGEAVEFAELIEKGDLAFFSKADEKISHVGICLGNESIIHAAGKVRIDKLDHHGIFNEELGEYSHQLRLIKRIKKAVDQLD